MPLCASYGHVHHRAFRTTLRREYDPFYVKLLCCLMTLRQVLYHVSVVAVLRIAGVLSSFSGFFYSILSEFDVCHTGRLSRIVRLLLCLCAVWARREHIAAVSCIQLSQGHGHGDLDSTTNLFM